MSKMKPYTRWRMSRLVKRLAFLTVLGCCSRGCGDSRPSRRSPRLPHASSATSSSTRAILPVGLTIALSTLGGLVYIVFFFGIFFIGGVETFKPGEIRLGSPTSGARITSFGGSRRTSTSSSVRRRSRDRGGYVPGGILLWGPPGTGKTLMAEASAGETGKPYVFVDPSAFVQTFVGVAPMKIKHLYRKLRKLALRYGGVVVFFDEADVLGSRWPEWRLRREGDAEQLESAKWLSPQGDARSPPGCSRSRRRRSRHRGARGATASSWPAWAAAVAVARCSRC